MRYMALASDYDGTLAHNGVVTDASIRALEQVRVSGRKLILVSGRELPDLYEVFPRLDLFDRVVAENGAVLYRPATRDKKTLAVPPPPEFLEVLRARGVAPVRQGDVIVATWEPHETEVLNVIRDLGLELQVIFNKGAVMALPSGVNKQTGLACALEELELSEHNVAGIGDAENDHALLSFCEFSAAVANALPSVKRQADMVTAADHGAGVEELIDLLLADDLCRASQQTTRRQLLIGRDQETEVRLDPFGSGILVAGDSGTGKSTLVMGFLEMLSDQRYQYCLIDPEGDYDGQAGLVLGDSQHAPELEQVMQALRNPVSQVAVNLIGIALVDRPGFLAQLMPRIREMRVAVGRPHWLIVDEAHHMLPEDWAPAMPEFQAGLEKDLRNLMMVTVHPEQISRAALRSVNMVMAVGPAPERILDGFAAARGIPKGDWDGVDLSQETREGQAVVWDIEKRRIRSIQTLVPKSERKRHKRKYALGDVGEDRSFYFRGPGNKLNLRAQNLSIFLQMAQGVDDETWLYHLRLGDYSRWFQEKIKDEELATAAARIEETENPDASRTREAIRDVVQDRYTGPE